jgi:glucokinase
MEIGGTSVRAARFDPLTGRIGTVRSRSTPFPPSGSPGGSVTPHHHLAVVLSAAAELGAEVLRGDRPDAVGVGYAGPIDANGQALASPTILRNGRFEPFDLASACAATWSGAQLLCVNDLTAAGLAHVAEGLRDFAILTVGSGIGHKVFLDGRVRVGDGRGGEIGHLRLDLAPDALRCDCGGTGHLGGLASGRGTVAMVRRQAERDPIGFRSSVLAARHKSGLEDLDGTDVAMAFSEGDNFVRSAVAASQQHLGQAVAAIHLDTGVEDIILTGGFAHGMGAEYVRGVAAAAGRCSWTLGEDWARMVRLDPHGESVALLGLGRALIDPRVAAS